MRVGGTHSSDIYKVGGGMYLYKPRSIKPCEASEQKERHEEWKREIDRKLKSWGKSREGVLSKYANS